MAKSLKVLAAQRTRQALARAEFLTEVEELSSTTDAPLTIESERAWWWEDGRELPMHFVMPDPQVAEGSMIDHIRRFGEYAVDKKPDVIALLMDWFDYPSLNSHERWRADYSLRSVVRDYRAGLHARDLLFAPLIAEWERSGYWPTIVCVEGNHDARIWRALLNDARFDGLIPTPREAFESMGALWYPYLQPVRVDGVAYCHFFTKPNSQYPYTGMIETRVKNVGFSFTQGHTPGKMIGGRVLGDGTPVRGCVVGSFYQGTREARFQGIQGDKNWRGMIVKHAVRNGDYNLMEVDLAFLERKYGGDTVIADGDYRRDDFDWGSILARCGEQGE